MFEENVHISMHQIPYHPCDWSFYLLTIKNGSRPCRWLNQLHGWYGNRWWRTCWRLGRPRWAQRVFPLMLRPTWTIPVTRPTRSTHGAALENPRPRDAPGRHAWPAALRRWGGKNRKEGRILCFDDKFIDENLVILVASSVCMCKYIWLYSILRP